MTADEFVKRLMEHQREIAVNDEQFSNLLALSPTYWSQMKRHRKPFGLAVVRGVALAFPELRNVVMEYLGSDPNDRPTVVPGSEEVQ